MNGIDDYLDSIEAQQRQQAALDRSMAAAATVAPDIAARQQWLAKQTGVPSAVVPLVKDQLEQSVRDNALRAQDLPTTAPRTADWLAKPDNMAVAHDDVGVLTAIERAIKYVVSAPGTSRGLAGDVAKGGAALASSVPKANEGLWGAAQAGAEVLSEYLTGPAARARILPEDIGARMAASFSSMRTTAKGVADATMPKADNVAEAGIYSGLQSLGNNLALFPLAIVAPEVALSIMATQTGGQAYGQARDKGVAPLPALAFASSQAVIEYATEKIPMARLIGDVKAGTPFLKTLAKNLALEMPGEQVATALQDLNEWAVLHPDKPFSDYLAERPSAAIQTAIATAVGSGGQVGTIALAQKVAERWNGKAQQADEVGKLLDEIQAQAAVSKLRERAPDTFGDFVAAAVADGPVTDIYINAQVLQQSGMAEQLMQASPAAAEQMATALATGTDIRIPLDEYAGRVAGQEFAQPLLDHLRTEADGMSRAEAQEFMKTQGEELQRTVEKALADHQGDQAFKADAEKVRTEVERQLNEVGRFTPDVNTSYATLMGSFYAAQAARLGITPTEMLARFPVRIAGQGVGGLEQSAPQTETPQFKTWFGDSKVVDATGKPLVVYHGTTEDFSKFDLAKRGSSTGVADAKQGFFFSSSGKAASEFTWKSGDMTGSVMPVYLFIQNPLIADLPGEWAPGKYDQALAQAKREGHDGVVIRGATTLGTSGDYFIAFKPEQIKSAIGNNGQFDSANPSILAQAARATFNPSTSTIALLKGADLSSFLHESGHFYLDTLTKLAADPAAPAEIQQDMAVLLDWMGVPRSNGDGYRGALKSVVDGLQLDAKNLSDLAIGKATLPQLNSALSAESLLPVFNRVSQAVNDPEVLGAVVASLPVDVVNVFIAAQLAPEDALHDPSMLQHGLSINNSDDISVLVDRARTIVSLLERVARAAAERAQSLGGVAGNSLDPAATKATESESHGEIVARIVQWQKMSLDEQRPYHEKFARGFERFLFEGNAPNIELQGIFQRFSAWLLNVYRQIKTLNVELTPEVRDVFDRMIATREQIVEAEAAGSMLPMFADQASSGMTPDQWRAYQALGTQQTADAITELEARSLRNMQWLDNAKARVLRGLQKEAAEKRKAVRNEVTAEVDAQPIEQARRLLKRGERADGSKVEGPTKLSIPDVKAVFDGDVAKLGYGQFGMLANDGLHPDVVAAQFGFSSGDELIRRLLAEEPRRDKIAGMTDQRMLERHGDLTDAKSMERAANAALHNQARAKMLETELRALEAANNVRADAGTDRKGRKRTMSVLPEAARKFAAGMVAKLKIRDLKPSQYTSAETRANRASDKAHRAGDTAQAAVEKRNALINHYAARAALDAVTEMEKGVAYLKRIEQSKTIDADYLDQIHALLEKFDLRQVSLRELDKRKSLADWIESQREMGLEPQIPQDVLDAAGRTNFKDLTVEQIRGLVDTVRQIEHLGRLKHKLLTARDQRDLERAVGELVASIEENGPDKMVDLRTRTTWPATVKSMGWQFLAIHRKMASYARQMDGAKDGGAVWEYFIRTMNDHADMEAQMRADATARLNELITPLMAGERMRHAQFFPGVQMSLTREERLGIALNTGNAGNKQRLLDGEGWRQEQLDSILATLTAADWTAVQNIWDYFESYRPQIAAKERRVYGKEPDWVEPVPFDVEVDGKTMSMRGGYYPVKYDPARNAKAGQHADAEDARQMLKGAYTSATTRRSFTKARAEEVVGRPLLYGLQGLYQGTTEVIHDLSWHEWLIDVNRLLRNKAVDMSIRTRYGAEAVDVFKNAIKDIAAGDAPAQHVGERILNHIRTGATVAGLGWNLTTSLLQPLGLTQSMVRIGPAWVARGMGQWFKAPFSTSERINEMSTFMSLRAQTQQREINEIRNKVSGQSDVRQAIEQSFFMMIAKMQQVADIPTWLGQYEKSIAAGETEPRAIALADQAVRDSQGGGQIGDLSQIQRGGPAFKLFTNFYSFFNVAYNQGAESWNRTDFKKPGDVMRLATDFLLLYSVPAALATLLKAALVGDVDDPEKLMRKLIAEQISYLFGLMVGVRELSAGVATMLGVQQFDATYSGPAGLRLFSEATKLAKQIQQGEWDTAMRKALVNTSGILFHLPSGQVNRTWDGVQALSDGTTQNPLAPLVGAPPKN